MCLVKPYMQLFNIVFVQFNHSEYKNLEDSMVVGVSLLTSYEHMGTLEMACYKGCTCNSSIYDTCNPNMAWSEVRWAFHPVKVSFASSRGSKGLKTCVLASPGLVLANFAKLHPSRWITQSDHWSVSGLPYVIHHT